MLDSNVIISGLAFQRGNPTEVLGLLRAGQMEVYISSLILEEVGNSFREDFGWSEPRIQEAISSLLAYCTIIDPPQEASLSQLSSADSRIFDCALQAQAQYLVTGDRVIQRVENFRGVAITSPADFLKILR